MPAIAGNESDLAVVAENGTSFEEVDDAVDGPNLDRRQRHCFVGVATSDFTSTLDAARPQPRAVTQTPGTGRGRHSYPGFDRLIADPAAQSEHRHFTFDRDGIVLGSVVQRSSASQMTSMNYSKSFRG